MSLMLADAEITALNAELEPKLAWAKTRSIDAERLALDCTRLLSCTEDRLGEIKNKGFFKRCWGSFTGKTSELERANTGDLIQLQKKSLQFIKLLQEQNLMLAHSMITIKNNLVTLAIRETETRHLLADLAERTLERFEALESRVGQLEVSANIQGWLVTIKEREYEEKFPTPYFRTLKIVNDFYRYKSDDWNFQDILYMKKALRDVGLDPKLSVTMNTFIDSVVDEANANEQGFAVYEKLILEHAPKDIKQFGHVAIENISSLVFTTMLGIHTQYADKSETIEAIREELSISREEALKRILRRIIKNMNVDLDVPLTLSDIAVEILASLRLSSLVLGQDFTENKEVASDVITVQENMIEQEKNTDAEHIDIAKLNSPEWIIKDLPSEIKRIDNIIQTKDGFVLFSSNRRIFLTTDFNSYKDVSKDEFHYNHPSDFFSIKEYNGKYASSGKISDDGIFWENIVVNVPANVESKNILFYDNTWYTITSKKPYLIYKSKDLKNWEHIYEFTDDFISTGYDIKHFHFEKNLFIIQFGHICDATNVIRSHHFPFFGIRNEYTRNKFFYSKDCLNWVESFVAYGSIHIESNYIGNPCKLIFLSGQYSFLMYSAKTLYYSKNGYEWFQKKNETAIVPYEVNVYPFHNICTGNTAGENGLFYMSNNGIEWTQYKLPYDVKRHIVISGNKCIALFPSKSKIATWNLL